MAVVRDQVQHQTALDLGIGEDQNAVYETYTDAALAVRDGTADAYASVARAHSGFIAQHLDLAEKLETVPVPSEEKVPAFGSFAFGRDDTRLRDDMDAVLSNFLGTSAHRDMVASFGFSSQDVDLVVA